MTLVPSAWAGVDFNWEIRPILAENCFYCDGQDPNHRKGNLRLDLREATLKPAESGGTAIVPGNAAQSALVTHIFSSERDEQMPPPNSNRKLSGRQKELLKQRINEGAEYQPHWAFVAPVRALRADSMWMAGGGVKGGSVFGETDDFAWNIVRDPVHIHDMQATILHLFGINHEALTYRFQGRQFRLSDVHGKTVKGLFA
jgi:hypothetical protein